MTTEEAREAEARYYREMCRRCRGYGCTEVAAFTTTPPYVELCEACGGTGKRGERRTTFAGESVPEVVDHEDALAEKSIHQQ